MLWRWGVTPWERERERMDLTPFTQGNPEGQSSTVQSNYILGNYASNCTHAILHINCMTIYSRIILHNLIQVGSVPPSLQSSRDQLGAPCGGGTEHGGMRLDSWWGGRGAPGYTMGLPGTHIFNLILQKSRHFLTPNKSISVILFIKFFFSPQTHHCKRSYRFCHYLMHTGAIFKRFIKNSTGFIFITITEQKELSKVWVL